MSGVVEAAVPQDKAWHLYWSLCLQGFGGFTPWYSIISSVDYFDDVYPDWSPIRWATLAYIVPAVITLLILMAYPSLCQRESVAIVGFICSSVVLAFIPIIELVFVGDSEGTSLTFGFFIFLDVVAGITTTAAEGSIIGITLNLPEQYPQAYIGGAGLSGLFIALLRVFTKASFSESRNGLQLSFSVFFFLSMFICLLCALVGYCVILDHHLILHYKNHKAGLDEKLPLLESSSSTTTTLAVLKKLRLPFVLGVIILGVTTVVFPGVTEDVECDALGDWYSILLVVIYNFFECVGRCIPARFVSTDRFKITFAVLARVLLLPVFVVFIKFFSNPFTISILYAITAAPVGYLYSSSYKMGQEMLDGYLESFQGGFVLLLSDFVGLCIGAGLSLIWGRFID